MNCLVISTYRMLYKKQKEDKLKEQESILQISCVNIWTKWKTKTFPSLLSWRKKEKRIKVNKSDQIGSEVFVLVKKKKFLKWAPDGDVAVWARWAPEEFPEINRWQCLFPHFFIVKTLLWPDHLANTHYTSIIRYDHKMHKISFYCFDLFLHVGGCSWTNATVTWQRPWEFELHTL